MNRASIPVLFRACAAWLLCWVGAFQGWAHVPHAESAWITHASRAAVGVGYIYDLPSDLSSEAGWAKEEALAEGGGMLPIQERHYLIQGASKILQKTITYTRGVDLSGTMSDAGGIGGLLARTDSSTGSSAYYHSDGGGNVVAMVNGSQAVVARYHYDPFGSIVSMSGPLAEENTMRFSSKEFVDTAGMYYYGYRFYDPNLQRWPNRDPIGEEGGINLYGFVGNGPVNGVDLDGRAWLLFDPEAWGQLVHDVFVGDPRPNAELRCYSNLALRAREGSGVSAFDGPDGRPVTGSSLVEDVALGVVSSGFGAATLLPAGGGRAVASAASRARAARNSAAAAKNLEAIAKGTGKGINVTVKTQREAEELIAKARPNIPWRNTYEAPKPKIGKEIHPPDGSGVNLPHIKWRDWTGGKANGAEGHIYFEGLFP